MGQLLAFRSSSTPLGGDAPKGQFARYFGWHTPDVATNEPRGYVHPPTLLFAGLIFGAIGVALTYAEDNSVAILGSVLAGIASVAILIAVIAIGVQLGIQHANVLNRRQ